jgi:hypothetical protein
MIQDISIYYEKCEHYCLSNDCPPTETYYKDPALLKCVNFCPAGFVEDGTGCVPRALCHSTCSTCSVKNDAAQCSGCGSSLTPLPFSYTPFETGVTAANCAITTNNNAQLLMTVNKNTALGTSLLKSVVYNSITQSASGTLLSSLLYKENVIEFSSLTSNTVSLNFDLLPVHKKILIRARVFTSCTATQNQTVKMTLSTPTPTIIPLPLVAGQENIIEGQAVHETPTLTVTFEFGTQAENCRKIIQDVSVYFEKCATYCNSNICPNSEPYFKHFTNDECVADCSPNYSDDINKICVNDCPDGYTEGTGVSSCLKFEYCHSTCAGCSLPNDPTKCSTCSSTLTSLAYNAITAPAACQITATNNAQYLMTVNKNTAIGTSELKSVVYNSITQSVSGTLLSSFLYKEHVIEFMTLGTNTIQLNFGTLPVHKKVIVRVRAYTECIATSNQTIQLTLAGTPLPAQTLTAQASTLV